MIYLRWEAIHAVGCATPDRADVLSNAEVEEDLISTGHNEMSVQRFNGWSNPSV